MQAAEGTVDSFRSEKKGDVRNLDGGQDDIWVQE